MSNRKLLIISSQIYPSIGGVETVVDRIASRFTKRGYDVTVMTNVYRHGFGGISGWVKEFLSHKAEFIRSLLGLPIHYSGNGRVVEYKIVQSYLWGIGVSFLKDFLAVLMLPVTLVHYLFLIYRLQPSVVNLHFMDGSTVYALIGKLLFKYKLVVSVHGSDWYVFRKNPLHRYFSNKLLQKADDIVVISDYLRESITEEISSTAEKIHVIFNGIPESWFEEGPVNCKELNPQGYFPYILFIGRLVPVKGVDKLLEAFRNVSLKNSNVKLLVVGDGPEREKLEKLSRTLNIADKVVFMGALLGDEIKCLLSKALCLVISSKTEGSPIVAVEAMSHKVPVVSTDVGSISVTLGEGRGIVVPVGDVEALSHGMLSLLDDENLRVSIAERAFVYAKKNLTVTAVIDKYENILFATE